MKYVTIFLLLGFSLGCNVVEPVSISGSVEQIRYFTNSEEEQH